MKAKITYTKPQKRHEMSKRFYIPGYIVEDTCPECAKNVQKDLSEDYLSNPVVGEPEELYFYCDSCFAEWQVNVVVNITVDLVQ